VRRASCSWPLALALASVVLLLAACGEAEVETRDVVGVIPWADGEEAHYRLEDRDGGERGRGTLRVDREGDRFRLSLRYSDDSNSDESAVLVDASTLKPFSVRREIHSEDTDTVVEAEYTGDQVRIRATSDSGVEQTFLDIPDHSYDNESSLFLWRTMPLAADYSASYNAVITNFRQNSVVTVRVSAPETVEVPAGVFEAWRVDVASGGTRQVAWYSADDRRLLVKYDSSRLVFLLEQAPPRG